MTSSGGPMSQGDSASARNLAVQREVARIALASVEGFALAGSSAIREHGMIDRPTEDVDLFTARQDIAHFGIDVDQIISRLRATGFTVDVVRRHPSSLVSTWLRVTGTGPTSISAWTGGRTIRSVWTSVRC